MRACHLRARQRGLSLVELMVALLLGAFLILGVTQLFLDQRRHAQSQFGQLANQGNARFAAASIERLVARAGYRARPELQMPAEAFPPRPAGGGCPAFAAGQTVALASSQAGAALCVRYQRGMEAEEVDCSGASLGFSAAPATVLARLTLDRATGELGCASALEGSGGMGATGVLVDGLVDFSFLPLPKAGDKVQLLDLYLLFASERGLHGGIASDVLDDWEALSGRKPAIPADDGRLLQIGLAGVALRNPSP